MFSKRKLVIYGSLLVFLFVFIGASNAATTIPVHPGSNAIKKAITKAHNGDTLKLSSGSYYEHDIAVNKNLTITGPAVTGSPKAAINGQYLGRVFNIYPNVKVNLKYLTIKNGKTSAGGGGIYNRGKLTISNCYINENIAAASGGGILNSGDGTLKVTKSSINSNTATNYGGGISTSYNTVSITSSTIKGNTAKQGSGGGIYKYYGTLTVTKSNITSNKAPYGGGISNEYGTLIVTGSNLNGNTASQSGGGINNYGTCNVTGSTIKSNKAYFGGGIYTQYNCTIASSNINSNTANYSGGGIDNNGTCTIYGSTINSNTSYYGGGTASNKKLTVNNCYIQNNKAAYGGGIHNQDTCMVIGSKIIGNSANPEGGGIYNFADSNLTVTDSDITSNTAGRGGGIYNEHDCTLNVTGCNFISNKANEGNAIFIYPWQNPYVIIHSNLFYDTAVGYEIYNDGTDITDARFNWWATNNNPASKVYGNVDVSSWRNDYIKPKITSTNPTNLKIRFSRTGTITIKFSENIYTSTNWSKITVKNLKTGKTTTITKSISRYTLYIKNTSKRSAYTWYQVTIPAGAVIDKTGNKLEKTYTFKFKTGA